MADTAGTQQPDLNDPGRILLSEWAGDSIAPRLLGAGHDRPACPICGHPTMDCTHDNPVLVRGGHRNG